MRRTPQANTFFCTRRIIALVSGTTTHPSGFLKVNLVWLLQCQFCFFLHRFFFFFHFSHWRMKQNSLLFSFTQHLPPFYVVSPLRPDAAPVEFSPYNLFRCKTPCRILNRKGEKNKMIVKVSLQGNTERCCHLECNKVSINS